MDNSSEQGKDLSFGQTPPIETPQKKLERYQVLGMIKERGEVTFSKLRKLSKWRETSLRNFMKQAEYSGLISSKMIIDLDGRSQKVLIWREGQ